MSNINIELEQEFRKLLAVTLAGNMASFNTSQIADTSSPEIEKYLEMIKPSDTRRFYSFHYFCRCLHLAKVYKDFFRDYNYVVAAILFHKAFYEPGGKLNVKKSCEIALEYYPAEFSVKLFSFIKATSAKNLASKRFGDDRDLLCDIVNHIYSLPFDEFKKEWAQILLEFQSAGYPPKKFKQFTTLHFRRILEQSRIYGIHRTRVFSAGVEVSAISNIQQMLEETLKS